MRARKSPPLSASCPAVSRMFKRLGLSKLSALEAADMSASRRAASGRPWGHADLGAIMVREPFAWVFARFSVDFKQPVPSVTAFWAGSALRQD